ncbi:MAG: hypothetical protein ACLTK0_00830 [Anaerovoracaceae bacterium]
MVAAKVLPKDFDILEGRFEEAFREKEKVFSLITEKALTWGVGIADNEIIDEINILQATKEP